ncbi:hypothetical protein N9250_00170 [bacterium]|nr:hypothetical protein [bacterium]
MFRTIKGRTVGLLRQIDVGYLLKTDVRSNLGGLQVASKLVGSLAVASAVTATNVL